MGFERCTVAID